MKRDALKIGSRTAAKRTIVVQDAAGKQTRQQVDHIVCQYDRPENVADCLKIAHGKEELVAAMFDRGWSIWLQDRVGRPMYEAGDKLEAIQAALDAAELGVTKGRGRPSKPREVSVEKKATYTAEEVAAIAARAGIKLVTQ